MAADGFLWLEMSVEDLNLKVQRSLVMNANGSAALGSSSAMRPLSTTARQCVQ